MLPPKCKPHQQRAGWHCASCNAPRCPDCVATKHVTYSTTMEVCTQCGELVTPLTQHRADQRSFAARIPGALGWPLSKQGLVAIAGVALVRTVLSYLPGLGWGLSACLFAAVCFGLVRSTARGSDDFETSDLSDVFTDVLVPGIKALVGTVLVWLPAALWLGTRHPGAAQNPLAAVTDPVVWLLLVGGVLYAPMAVLSGAAGSSLFAMLSPLHVVRNALKLGQAYGLLVVVLGVLFFPWLVVLALGTMLNLLPVPFLPRLLDHAVACYVPFVASRIMGLLLYTHGDRVEYGLERDYQVALLPGVPPRGVAPEAPAEQKRSRAPIELPPEPEPLIEATVEKPRELDPDTLPPLKVE
ncbi:MAG: hypothetical protein JNK82_43180 [Myxococcaceae bacterium]|nr:hypothetical protein [Myxococcaceae bacterium]